MENLPNDVAALFSILELQISKFGELLTLVEDKDDSNFIALQAQYDALDEHVKTLRTGLEGRQTHDANDETWKTSFTSQGCSTLLAAVGVGGQLDLAHELNKITANVSGKLLSLGPLLKQLLQVIMNVILQIITRYSKVKGWAISGQIGVSLGFAGNATLEISFEQ